jgi:hypothetical protein
VSTLSIREFCLLLADAEYGLNAGLHAAHLA